MAIKSEYRSSYCGNVTPNNVGQKVTVAGWVHRRRDHGGVIFIDLRDHTGIVQLVFNPTTYPALDHAHTLRSEFVISVVGTVTKRSDATINKNMATGEIEIVADSLTVINKSLPLPFNVADEDENISEELRLTYRYLDLRTSRMQDTLRLRHNMIHVMRNYLHELEFCDIETPILSKSTPGGARDYLVPSRLNPGKFYALPQSPQIYKQLLMVGGMNKYYQIARCFRDEALRADRQPEFTQLDIEMAFTDEKNVREVIEGLMAALWEKFFGKKLALPLNVFEYKDVYDKYGSDKPDLRFDLPIQNITTLFESTTLKFLQSTLKNGGQIGALCIKDYAFSRAELESWVSRTIKEFGGSGMLYIRFDEDGKPNSPVASFLPEDFLTQAQKVVPGITAKDTLFIVAGDYNKSWLTLGKLRTNLGHELKLIDKSQDHLFWVTRFPLFEYDEETKNWVSCHHPFTSPEVGSDLSKPGGITARSYDLVWNGYEIGGGSIRIHDDKIQEQMFTLLGIGKEEAEQKFGFLLNAFKLGCPPHGGIALGIDRLIMMFAKISNIRDTIAFPKNQSGICMMMEAPTPVEAQQLRDLQIRSTYVAPEEK